MLFTTKVVTRSRGREARGCGTAGKPDGNRENKPRPVTLGETSLPDSLSLSKRLGLCGLGREECLRKFGWFFVPFSLH